jgi:hypothetical protein
MNHDLRELYRRIDRRRRLREALRDTGLLALAVVLLYLALSN